MEGGIRSRDEVLKERCMETYKEDKRKVKISKHKVLVK